MDDSLDVESLILNAKQFGLTDMQNMVKNHIKRHDESVSSMFEVSHSYIDLRPIYLEGCRQRLNQNSRTS